MVDTTQFINPGTLTDPTTFQTALDKATQNTATTFAPIPQMNLPTVSGLSDYYKQAFQQLQPYYQQKLTEAKGDVTEAMRRIDYDYSTGVRYNVQDTQLAQQRQTEDLNSAMDKLGLTFKNETQQKQDDLNKRGIGVTENPGGSIQAAGSDQVSYDQNGKPIYSGNQGQAGSELSMLSEDQRLRKEAETRAANRNLQDIGIKYNRQDAALGETKQEGTYDTTRQYQQTGETLGEQQQQQAFSMAGQQQTANTQQQQLQAQKDLANAQVSAAKQEA